jgi:hypothetical protein
MFRRALVLLISFAFCLLAAVRARAGTVYQEDGGLVIMEMENTSSPLGQWIEINPGEPNYVSGATGTGHLEFTGNGINGGNPNSPLTYTFQINLAGNYHLNLRARKRLDGEASDKCNDCYVKMAGNSHPAAATTRPRLSRWTRSCTAAMPTGGVGRPTSTAPPQTTCPPSTTSSPARPTR